MHWGRGQGPGFGGGLGGAGGTILSNGCMLLVCWWLLTHLLYRLPPFSLPVSLVCLCSQLMMGGGTYSIEPDEYVFAAISIYLVSDPVMHTARHSMTQHTSRNALVICSKVSF